MKVQNVLYNTYNMDMKVFYGKCARSKTTE